ncbi:hypothetical protein [Pseudonocardia sp. H11422]|uniref:hypothetical protein n=1 Tax=Pseudonocardia sp. H11422 TaxID=2835866 RepID=UPI001BDCA7E8|nr:hypothetical protein [Pseudonocardia sp. H11422]
MTYRVFFLNKLRPGVDPADYEAWIRRADYPIVRSSPGILSYDVTRIEGTLDGESTPSVSYLEVIEVTDIDGYRAIARTPEFVKLLEEWGTYVELDEALHGGVIE